MNEKYTSMTTTELHAVTGNFTVVDPDLIDPVSFPYLLAAIKYARIVSEENFSRVEVLEDGECVWVENNDFVDDYDYEEYYDDDDYDDAPWPDEDEYWGFGIYDPYDY